MIWALIEIILPMLLTFLFGLLVGWLIWRDGRVQHTSASDDSTELTTDTVSTVEATDNNALIADSHGDMADSVDDLSQSPGRFMHEQALAKELNAANASIRSLVAELDVTRTRLRSCENQLESAGDATESVVVTDAQTEAEQQVLSDQLQATNSQLQALQQKYQALEASHIVDKAELAKHHHLESRLNLVSRELADNKVELANAKKIAAQSQADLQTLQAELDTVNSTTNATTIDPDNSDVVDSGQQAREYQSQIAMLQARLQQSESKVRQIEASGERIEQLDSQLQTRLADELESAQQRIQTLEQQAGQSTDKAAELVRVRSRLASLETELGIANSRAEDAEKLQRRVSELESMLKGTEVASVNERLVEAEAQLRIANNRVTDQQRELLRLRNASAESEQAANDSEDDSADPSAAAVKQANTSKPAGTTEAAGTIKPGKTPEPAKKRAPVKAAQAKNDDWQQGVTRFGTPGARHKDDLKVIRGIGPVLERTLNDADIQTWEQLAALNADEITLIEQSIDFPGRMTREQWVEQATELVAMYPDIDNRPRGKNLLPKKNRG
jgi:predicted flap endonuclease-1-like 5' DNA nuclease